MLYAPYCTSVAQHLKESGRRYDLVFLFRPGVVERHIKTIRKHSPQTKVLFHTVDLHYLRLSREAELHKDKVKMKAADEMKRREFALIRAVDTSIVVSTTELELLRLELPNERIRVFPLIMDIPGTDKEFKDRRDIIFVGGYQHAPNIDAVRYFVNDVMPILRRRLPSIHFYVVGSKPPAEIQALASEDVIITGFVEDLSSLLDRMRVSVAPLRYGAGIKGKIGTAMAVGLPTVATSLAAEGMSLTNGEDILVADGAEAFAEAVARLHEDEALWNNLSQTGLDFAKKTWGAEAAWVTLDSILSNMGILSVRGNRPLTLYSPRRENVTYFHRIIEPKHDSVM
jgi:glycosyltransferase involved in cell wall biosynthesis